MPKDAQARSHGGGLLPGLCSLVLALFCGMAIWAALVQLHYHGQPQSFDTLIYARSLWGIAHGDFNNPVLGSPTFFIHGNFVLFVLAPFVRWFASADVLMAVQSMATVGLVFTVSRASSRAADGIDGIRSWGVVVWVTGVFFFSPLILNPLLFGARPEHLGGLLVAVGLIRTESRGLDRWTMLLLLLAPLAREELGVVVAAGLVLAPPGSLGVSLVKRWGLAFLAGGYTLFFWVVLQPALGPNQAWDAAANIQLMSGIPESGGLSFLMSKVEVLGIALVSGGLLCAVGWRWLGAAVPGLALLLVNRYQYDNVLDTHYAMLMAPGLAVALVNGVRRWSQLARTTRFAVLALSIIVSIAAYVHSGAGPAGGRFMAEHYQLDASPDENGLTALERGHALVSSLPSELSVASTYIFGTRLADREVIWSLERFREELMRGAAPPSEVEAVVLLPQEWLDYGRVLANRHGFRLTGLEPGIVAILQRTDAQAIVWETVRRYEPPGDCDQPYIAWPRAGLAVCQAMIGPDRRITITLMRVSAPIPELDGVAVAFALTSADGVELKTDASSVHGLVNPVDLPPGETIALITQRPIASTTSIAAFTVEGNILPLARRTNGGTWEAMGLYLPFTAREGRDTVLVEGLTDRERGRP